MKRIEQVFFALVRAGLWEQDVWLKDNCEVAFSDVLRLSEEQSVVGLVTAGMEHVRDIKVSQDVLLQFIGESLQIEEQNKSMNDFLNSIMNKMRKEAGVYALLVKGQGIAQCYERPLWRACGDIDLLLSKDNYDKAKLFLIPLASSTEEESIKSRHLGMTIDNWIVELHGTLHSGCLNKIDKVIDEVQHDLFYEGNVRSWLNNGIQIFLPAPDNDVFLIFAHIIKHFFRGGIGLRQICDWCRLLWTYREALNVPLLKDRIYAARIMTEWNTFASLAVDYLGMKKEAIPLYSSKKKWKTKARKVVEYIIKDGNFGHNRDLSFYSKDPFILRKLKALRLRTYEFVRLFVLFPIDSLIVWNQTLKVGILSVLKGETK